MRMKNASKNIYSQGSTTTLPLGYWMSTFWVINCLVKFAGNLWVRFLRLVFRTISLWNQWVSQGNFPWRMVQNRWMGFLGAQGGSFWASMCVDIWSRWKATLSRVAQTSWSWCRVTSGDFSMLQPTFYATIVIQHRTRALMKAGEKEKWTSLGHLQYECKTELENNYFIA